ncbi:hypothetical protein KR018_001841 [Drosophila ironensis]|nr:hypothetical protein KR018_001841 [Drosophila ironensis]
MSRWACRLLRSAKQTNYARRTFCATPAKHEAIKEALPRNVLVEKDAHITLIGLNREQKRNSIDSATAEQLTEAIVRFEEDETSPVGVLYGLGGSICAGHDLEELEAETQRGNLNFLLRHEGSLGPTRRHLRKPLVCGINGYCVAGGLELALLCDLRVMEDTAVLGFFNRRLGAPLSDGGSVRLAAAVGYSRALDIIETGRRVQAREALRMGLINRVVATGTALGQAVNLAFSIAKYPMGSLMHDRNAVLENANAYNRPGFRAASYNEILNVTGEMMREMQDGVERFRNCGYLMHLWYQIHIVFLFSADTKGPKTNSWHIKEKTIPDWEKAEIEIERKLQHESLL